MVSLMNRYQAKDVAFDGLFSALAVLLLSSLYFLPFNRNFMATLLLMGFACAYARRKAFSALVSSVSILALSFLFMDPLVVLFYVFPSLLFGFLFRRVVSRGKALFYSASIALFALLFFLESYLYTTFFLGEDFVSYVLREGIDLTLFGFDPSSGDGPWIVGISFLALSALTAILESILFQAFREWYDERLRFLVERT